MAFHNGPKINTDSLVFTIDANNPKSYTTGLTASDMVNDAIGTLINGVGFVDNSWDFDGVNDYINFGDIHDFDTNESFTIEMWINATSLNTNNTIIGKTPSSPIGYVFGILQSKPYFYFKDNSGGRLEFKGDDDTIDLDTWYHQVITYSGSKTAAGTFLYLNTISQSKFIYYNDLSNDSAGNSQNLSIGSRNDGSVPFNGKVSSVKIYNRVLSSTEITKNYEAIKNRFI